jgi:hypothetical protein
MARPTALIGPIKQLHCKLLEAEHRRIKTVAADAGKEVTELIRELFMPEIDRRYSVITGHGKGNGTASKRKARSKS